MAGTCKYDNETSGYIKCEEFLEELTVHQLYKKDLVNCTSFRRLYSTTGLEVCK